MKKHTLPLFLLVSIFLAACGGAGSSGPGIVTLKYPGTDKQEVPIKSGGFYVSTKTWSKDGKMTTSSSHFICVANHEIDISRGAISLGSKVSRDDQIKVCFSIAGAESSEDETPLKTGTFPQEKRSEFFGYNTVSSASIRIFKDGKEKKMFLNDSKTNGDVKVASASADSISGEINLSDGENEIKGTFSAQSEKKK